MPAAPLQSRRSPPTSAPLAAETSTSAGPSAQRVRTTVAPVTVAATTVAPAPGVPAERLKTRESAQPREPPTHLREPPHTRWPLIWSALVAVLIFGGARVGIDRYVTPQRGLGYWLGIVGGSMMLLLLTYSARKRVAWLRWMGSIPAWFRIHITLGVVGPVLVLFHTGFHFGATNSNVALVCMLLVAGSGVIGRYIYTRINSTRHGKLADLQTLRAAADRIRSQTTSIAFFPELMQAIEREEKRLFREDIGPLRGLLQVMTAAPRTTLARWRLHRAVRSAIRGAIEHDSTTIVRHARRIHAVVRDYVDRRLDAGRRAAEYDWYVRLFSLWHVLHIPLFFMLLIAAIAHVIAVNIY